MIERFNIRLPSLARRKQFAALIILMLVFQQLIAGQTGKFQIQSESGIGSFKGESVKIIWRSRLNAEQTYRWRRSSFNWKLFYQPELFDFSIKSSSQRLRGSIRFNNRFRQWFWTMQFQARYFSYRLDEQTFNWQSGNLTVEVLRPVKPKIFWDIQVGYWYRDSDDFSQQSLNALILQQGISVRHNNMLYQTGTYTERFKIRPRFQAITKSNSGYRVGLFFKMSAVKAIIFNSSYYLIYHRSEFYNRTNIEHQFKILIGKWLSPDWSLLFFTYITKRQPKFNTNETELLYAPADHQNRVYFKLGRDISKNREFYLKLGYEQEVLIKGDYEWSYWQLLAGMNFRIK
ncbi:MAG: hypothetical protein GXO77_02065 [Calditrichaeota bacterium]|nr:hypothetical protein [Calditrichota bacterium]